MVKIDSGPLEATDRFKQVPKAKWDSLVCIKRDFLSVRINYDCRCLVEFCEEAEIVWKELGYESAADMIENGYELDPVEVELAIAWLKHNGVDKAISLPEIGKRQRIQQLAADNPDWSQQQLAEEVGVSRQYVHKVLSTDSCESQKAVDIPSNLKGSHERTDFRKLTPELQQQVATKAISLNAAAIQAGIRKKPTPASVCLKSFTRCDDKLTLTKSLLALLDETQRLVVHEWLQTMVVDTVDT